jgi:hypothetical protein
VRGRGKDLGRRVVSIARVHRRDPKCDAPMMRPKITTPAVFVSAREMSPAIFVQTARKPSAIAKVQKVGHHV